MTPDQRTDGAHRMRRRIGEVLTSGGYALLSRSRAAAPPESVDPHLLAVELIELAVKTRSAIASTAGASPESLSSLDRVVDRLRSLLKPGTETVVEERDRYRNALSVINAHCWDEDLVRETSRSALFDA